jgi:flagellar hook-basal body complex protein FliE
MPINPISGGVDTSAFKITPDTNGAEWSVGSVADGPATKTSGGSFGSMLSNQLQGLETTQNKAAEAAQSLATGDATDPTAAIVAVERARLAMQMASTMRTKGIEAFQEVLRTQI